MKLNQKQTRRFILPALLLIVALFGNLIISTPRAAMTAPGTVTAADANPWQDIAQTQFNRLAGERSIGPVKSRGLRLNRAALAEQLKQAALERTPEAAARPLLLPLPYPDGTFKTFRVVESPIMEPGLAAKFPDIKTYFADSPEDPAARARFDLTPQGFHAMILSDKPTILIDPPIKGDTEYYLSYYKGDLPQTGEAWHCGVEQEISAEPSPQGSFSPAVSNGATLRAYRIAVAATGEFTAANGGTVASALSAVTTIINRVNAVFERDLATRLTLVANNDQIIYTNAATDPYTGFLGQNQTNLDNVIGTANYDIGHLLSFGRGGVAALGSVCSSMDKAQAFTAVSTPADYWVAAHEIGHQFGAFHSFNGSTSSCSGNRFTQAAYEPGSGSTIMSYAGICGSENLQAGADDYFHVTSLEEITANVQNRVCAVRTATGNALPTVSAGASFTIPIQTPFTLTATGSDQNGDALTYCWEQYNLGATSPPNTDDGGRPIFRSFPPTPDRSRTFPQWSDILNNTTTLGESLPTTTRTLTFQVTVRDNRAGGGAINSAKVDIPTTNTAGPFLVTSPNTAVTWETGAAQTVTWDVANTDLSPVNCANVKIKLSTDGGLSFPFTLLNSTPNTGSAEVIAPVVATTQARIKVEAADNIFFDVSNVNFSLMCPAVTGAVAGGGAICLGGSANVTVTVSGGSAPYTVTLSNGGGAQTGASPTFTFPVSPGASTAYTVAAGSQDANGCAISGSGSATVTVNPNTPPSLGIYPATSVTAGGGATVTPNVPPSGNGSVASLTATAPGFTGTFAGNPATGVITITNANPPGNYTVTVTATSDCGAQAITNFSLTVNAANNPPTITGATISRQQGSPASTSQIATVGDANQTCNTLGVTATLASGSGVTLSGISVNASCQVTASVTASCTATNSTFNLTVTDSQGATANALLTVNVTGNTAPSPGTYPAASATVGGGATVTPNAAPSDNGSIASLTATAPGFTGTFAVNPATGVVTITNAGPAGTFTATVRATDNCGVATTRTFTLTAAASGCSVTVNPATVKQPYVAVPYVELLSASPAGNYSFSVSAGALPPGLQLAPALGITSIAGLPTTPGTYTFTIKARKNGTTCEGTRSYTVTIPATVVPILECVQRNQNGSYTARFGYLNQTSSAVTIPVGANNYFTPGNQNRGQTTVFQPGRVTNAFSVTFKANGSNLGIWFLKGPDGVLRPVNVLTTSIGCP